MRDADAGASGVRIAVVLGSSTGGIGSHVASLVRGLIGLGHHVRD